MNEKVRLDSYVTDMGTGGSICSNCGVSVDILKDEVCPGCKREWFLGEISEYNFGGSDF